MNSVTYEILPEIYSIKDISTVVYTITDHEGTLQIKNDDISMKTKHILTWFGETFGTLRIDEKSIFITLLGFTLCWDYKPTNTIHADSPGAYTNVKILYLGTIKKFI